jgi:hypothetical protein
LAATYGGWVSTGKGEIMINARASLIVTGIAFGLWEAADILLIDVPAVAAVFAALFLGYTAWFWRRDSARAAVALFLLFAFEVAVAPTLHAAPATKMAMVALGLAGIAAAIAVLARVRRVARSPAASPLR